MTVYGQWNRGVTPDLGAPDRYVIPEARLKQYGFKDMHQFRNWRWYKGKGGGPIVDLGSHQIDIYSWFLGVNPSHVMASGGNLYYDPKTHEWYDTVMVVYDYDTPLGPAKGYYSTQTTNGSQGYFENFMGDQGTLLISESEVNYAGQLYRDPNAPAWDEWVQKGYVSAPEGAGDEGQERRRRDCRRARVGRARSAHGARDAARSVSPAAPSELLRRDTRQGDAQLPGRGSVPDRGRGAESQRSDRGEDAAGVQARRLQDITGSGDMEDARLSRSAMIAITLLRVIVGWHFLYEGIAKLTSSSWSAAGYMRASRGPFAEFFRWIASQPQLLDKANLDHDVRADDCGRAADPRPVHAARGRRAASASSCCSTSATRRLSATSTRFPTEGSYLIVNKNLVELCALAVILVTGSGRFAGLDRIVHLLLARRPRLAAA